MSASYPKSIGKYEVQGILGRGGMGTVYKAFDPAIHRQVAIKTITKSALDPSELQYAIARFRHEAQAVGRLTHPRIAAIYDYGEDDDLAFIVMELVNGKSLYEHLQNKAKFDLAEIGEIVRQLLDGLGYAHAQGVVHRDVKPSNILINDDGRIKISDFGIAHLDSSSLTQVGEIMGSPGYMSPEQFTGDEPDARTDIYSAGVIAYELLAGRKPFTGSNVEIMRQVIGERPANPSEFNPRISVQLDWAMHKALAKKREDRFQTSREFALAFVQGIAASLRHGKSGRRGKRPGSADTAPGSETGFRRAGHLRHAGGKGSRTRCRAGTGSRPHLRYRRKKSQAAVCRRRGTHTQRAALGIPQPVQRVHREQRSGGDGVPETFPSACRDQ
jgi:serine/threonine protein kinase